jgi:RNA polymerase sigma-70 factor (ECF subfamily)
MVRRRCLQLVRDTALADDLTQGVFVSCLRFQERLSGDYPSSLLFRMATNASLNALRSIKRHPADRDEEVLLSIASQDEGHNAYVARTVLDRIFSREQESTRVIAVLYHLDGMTLEEVAKETGLSISGVRKRLMKLRERVQALKEVV